MQKNIFILRTLIILALLAAFGAVFGVFSLKTAIVKISLMPIPVMIAGVFFGPLAGGLVGFVADTAGYFMGGGAAGAYNPVFSVTMALFGVIAGLFYLRNKDNKMWKAIASVTTAQIVCSVILNTLAIWLFYGAPIIVLMPTRAIGAAIELPIYVVLMALLIKALGPIALRRKRRIQEETAKE